VGAFRAAVGSPAQENRSVELHSFGNIQFFGCGHGTKDNRSPRRLLVAHATPCLTLSQGRTRLLSFNFLLCRGER